MADNNGAIRHERSTVEAGDGRTITVDTWLPHGDVRGVVQVLHGMSEHRGRYGRFAGHCAGQGLAVVVHDHRGHGDECAIHDLGHFADQHGWDLVIDDVDAVFRDAQARFAGKPVILFAHSMGSYIAQAFVMRKQPAVAGLVLSGSNDAPRLQLHLGRLVARIESWIKDRRYPSPRLNAMAFGAFNKRFEPARTAFDWLSRDENEVDRYVDDPLCGGIPTAGLWIDLLGGLLEIGTTRARQGIPSELPILITGGGHDPVGGRRGMQRLLEGYVVAGHQRVELKVFEGARHEMLNETNRVEFTDFVLDWMEHVLR